MSERIAVKEWQKKFIEGKFESKDRATQIEAGWYDWFCQDTSLANKTKRMGNIIKKIKEGGKVDLNNWYVWFKNNCPIDGPLYDDFRFANLGELNVQFTVAIDCHWEDCRYAVYGRANDFYAPLFRCDTVKELVDWFNTPWRNDTVSNNAKEEK